MKRLAFLAIVLVVGALTWLAMHSAAPKQSTSNDSAEKQAFKGSQERLAKVTSVDGQPVTDVMVNGKPVKAIAGELLVKTADPAALQASGNSVEETGLPSIYKLELPTQANLNTETGRVRTIAGVTKVNPNYVVTATTVPNDPNYGSQYALPKMSLPTAWDRTTGDSSVTIASIDTGVNWNHQDLSGRNWVNTNEIPDNNIDDDDNGYVDDYYGMDFANGTFSGGKFHNDSDGPMDDHGHGSLTTGVFAANTNNGIGVAGLTWQGKYVPIKVLDSSGFGSFQDVAEGIRYATAVGAKVMNLSLGAFGVTSDTATDDAIDDADAAGEIIAAASGNDGSKSTIDYPAYNPKAVAVGSTTSNDVRSSFSNGGAGLDLTAPGSGIMTVQGVSGGVPVNNQYASFSGTSLSTPQVSGVAALLAGLNPYLSNTAIINAMKNGADKVAGMGGQASTSLYGNGRLNAQGALNQLPAYSSQWAGQSVYPTVGSGKQTTVYVDYKNVGSSDWSNTGSNPMRLATSHPRDRFSPFYSSSWISPNRPATFSGRVESGSVVTTATVHPGETARFPYTITGPPVGSNANFREYVQLVRDGSGWLEDQGVFWDMTVQPRTYTYNWASQTYPPSVMQPGERRSVTLDITNTGTATWRNNTLYNLNVGAGRSRDRASPWNNNTWQSANRLAKFAGTVSGGTLTPGSSVAPGQTARYSFDFVAPGSGGNFREYFEPVEEGFAWLGDKGIYWDMYVPPPVGPNWDYQPVSQSAYPTVNKDGTSDVTLRVRNTGQQTWHSDGANPVKLGTDRARDRLSGFYTSGQGWQSPNRIKLAHNITDSDKDVSGETSIAPGEVGEFDFKITGNPPPGFYNEYFTPVVDGIQWMTDRGVYWTMTVQKPIKVGLAQQTSAVFSADGPVTFKDEAGTIYGTIPANQVMSLSWDGLQYHAGGAGQTYDSSSPIRAEQTAGGVLGVGNLADNAGNNRFRGAIMIKNGGPGTWLVNDINLEDYLKGLGEVPDSWPPEAIRAQVVAARTYGARRIANPQNAVFDIYDTTQDQVYNGYNNEAAKPNHVTAINGTKGTAIYKGGSLIQAYYYSDSGGATESNENAWGGSPIDYLRSVSDPYQKPDIWSKTVSNATLQSNFGHTGNIDSIDILEYYPSGRAKTIRLTTSGGSVTTHTQPADTQRSDLTTRSSVITGIGRSGNDWVFGGRGFGHGIGLAQWGAFNQANAGRNFPTILKFYYQGVNLGFLY
ncbi:SpoIID/LytB domain-containing protein [Patescibacteria group bacterium]|nr:SpoIID/LytB domain-containing protein [Patescibacteria group bacterium]